MVEIFQSKAGFGEHPSQFARADSAGVIVRERAGDALAIVTARRGMAAELAKRVNAMGIVLPLGPKREAQGSLAFLGIGPERWLATLDHGANTSQSCDAWAKSLAHDLAGCASVVDQTGGYAVLQISGAKAQATLAKGVAIDLHPRAFRAGDVAVTQIAHIGVMLWQLDDQPTYAISVFRSLAGSFWHWLSVSAEEFGIAVGGAVEPDGSSAQRRMIQQQPPKS
jgi:heterotetrameric sarcosine oxidase gamma subunit